MPEKKTIERARRAKREKKAPTTQAGEFVREEMRERKHATKTAKQAIAVGLTKGRRAGVKLPAAPPGKAEKKASGRTQAKRVKTKASPPSTRRKPAQRSRAAAKPLERATRSATSSSRAPSRQPRKGARRRRQSTSTTGRSKRPAARG